MTDPARPIPARPFPARTIPVTARSGSYDVVAGHSLASDATRLFAHAGITPPRSVFVVLDEGVPAASAAPWISTLQKHGFRVHQHAVRATESHKSLDELRAVLTAMAMAGLDRGDVVAAIGGGIIGDLAGFAASVYQRGIRVVQIPTTLLAMVDASVGGKTGVNLRVPRDDSPGDGGEELRKNFVGAFHQPRLVLADVSFLSTLPARQLRCGLAECLKHGLLSAAFGEAPLFDWTTQQLGSLVSGNPEVLVELVARNVAVKARVVGLDEREDDAAGGRALLNLGHTFAHAIETIPTLTPDGDQANAPLHHGEAVALGLVAAAATGTALGVTPPHMSARIVAALRLAGLPTSVTSLPPPEDLLRRMAHDKKTQGGKLRLIIPAGDGTARVVRDPPQPAVVAGWDAIRQRP